MAVAGTENPLLSVATCGSMLQQLQIIWDEVGETDEERDKMLLQLEQECLEVYKRKVDQATRSRALLLQSLADSKAELVGLLSSLGEKSVASFIIHQELSRTLLGQLSKRKEDRIREIANVLSQIQKIRGEIVGTLKIGEQQGPPVVDEEDLSLKKLEEYQSQLQELQKEESDRLQNVLEFVSTIHDLCAALGLNFFSIVTEVHPSLNESVRALAMIP